MKPDRSSRFYAAVGAPGLRWIWQRVHAKTLRGEPCVGVVRLQQPTLEQRDAVSRLLGEVPRGRAVSVSLRHLRELLADAGVAESLEDAAAEVLGEAAIQVRESRVREREAWAAVFAESSKGGVLVTAVVAEVRNSGLLKRLSGGSPQVGARLLNQLRLLAARLPAEGRAIAQLAAEVAGDAHALDEGSALGTLGVRLANRKARLESDDDSAAELDRREAWAAVGVVCDELSAPALALNLRTVDDSPLSQQLALHAAHGEPSRLSLRQLVRTSVQFAPMQVFVCENPSVLAAIADTLGPDAPPAVCTEGMPKTAVHQLLKRIRQSGGTIRFHADFDWAGLLIGNVLMHRHGARPLRMGVEDYESAPAGPPLVGVRTLALWDQELAAAMARRGYGVHEEQVLQSLLRAATGELPRG